jgi:hypothetical protein
VFSVLRRGANETCGPCYGLLPDGECCPTCERLIFLAARQGQPAPQSNWAQCKHHLLAPAPQSDERCLIKGKITVYRIRGDFHIATGRNLRGKMGHAHDLLHRIPQYDLSHKIEKIRFGPKIPTTRQPLEDLRLRLTRKIPAHSQYTLVATAVTYKRNGIVIDRRFEYTARAKHWEMHRMIITIPGMFFVYQFSPYRVIVNVRSRPVFGFV